MRRNACSPRTFAGTLVNLAAPLATGLAFLTVSCSDNGTAPSDPGNISLTIVSGNNQSGQVGKELPLALVIKATNPNGTPIANLAVDFRVISGGGSMYVVATTTGSTGLARNYWTLGTSTSQTQRVEVRAILSSGTKQVLGTFNATPLPGPAASIAVQAGDGQSATGLTAVAIPPSVLVSDQYGNPVPSVSITFAVTSGGGSITGAITSTNASGLATVGSWTMGPTLGLNTLSATAAGGGIAGNPVQFTATATGNFWRGRASMPTARNDLTAGEVNGIVYAVAGKTGNTCVGLTTVEAYDPATDTWSGKASLPTGRFNPRAVGIGGKLYVVGGDIGCGFRSAELDVYNPGSNTWTVLSPMPTARTSLSAAALNGLLYVMGGVSGNSLVTTVEAYDPASNTWTTKAPLPLASCCMVAGVVNGTLYVAGGSSTQVYAYDPGTDAWTSRSSMPLDHGGGVSGGVLNGVLYTVGGAGAAVDAYDTAIDSWASVAPTLTVRDRLAVAVAGGVMFAVGGGPDNAVSATVEAYQP